MSDPQPPSPSDTRSAPAPAVVVMAYDRPVALARLLRSIESAVLDQPADLVISVDDGGSNRTEILDMANAWVLERWPHGHAEVIQRPRSGLVDHFHTCGDLTERFGSIVLLEDDLTVGPSFHRWATAALDSARDDDRVAGVCLSSPWFDGYRQLPFEPVLDGSDGYYLQVPWFHGMAWTTSMWGRYRSWRRDRPVGSTEPSIHESFATLDGDEWFPDAVRYLVDTERTYLMPHQAHATNHGDAGQHFDTASSFFHVPVHLGSTTTWAITPYDDALAIYDDHMELTEGAARRLLARFGGPDLGTEPVTIDLLAVRDLDSVSTEWVLTTRPVERATARWGMHQRPPIMNIVGDEPGDDISLARVADIDRSHTASTRTEQRLERHGAHGRSPRRTGFARSVADRTKRLRESRSPRG